MPSRSSAASIAASAHFGFFGGLETAAGYIGITEAQLDTELEGGKSLAQVAKDHGKSVDGLVAALVADAKTEARRAVSAGRLTKPRKPRCSAS